MRLLTLFISLSLFPLSLLAQHHGYSKEPGKQQQQKGVVTGQITDANSDQQLEYATVSLLKKSDSSLVTGTITNKNGKFTLQPPYGHYFLRIEFISYKTKYIPTVKVSAETPTNKLGTITLRSASQELEEVQVTAEKGQVQVGLDKKVFNVDKDISNTGGSAQDVLENVPSVQVDMDGNVNLRGNSNVRILINGKPSGLTGISGDEALQQLPAEDIKRVEVITNPSAKYDAEGLAGIINIILKKDRKKGLNGLFSLTGGYPHNHTGSANLNFRTGNWNFFGSYSARYRERPGQNDDIRNTPGDSIPRFEKIGDFTRKGWSHTVQLGTDYNLNDKNTITVSGLYSLSPGEDVNINKYSFYDPDSNLVDYYERTATEDEEETNTDVSLRYQRNFTKEKQKLTADIQYSNGYEQEEENIEEQDFNLDKTPANTPPLRQRFFNKEAQSTWLFQADYVHPTGQDSKFEIGYKSTLEDIDKDYEIEEYDNQDEQWEFQPDFSNHFLYRQDVHAGYVVFSDKIKTFSYQLGLRGEQTQTTTILKDTKDSTQRSYLDFFPSIHLSQSFLKTHKMQLSYSRRINRPSFWTLNPIWGYSDDLNFWAGNPKLQPEYTHSVELGYIKYFDWANINSSIYYRHTDDAIVRLTDIDSNGVSITRPYNVATEDAWGAELTFSVNPFKWWRLNGSFNYYRSRIDAENIAADYTADFYTWTGRVNTQLTLWQDIKAQLMFNYRGPRETPQGKRLSFYFMDVALQRSFWNDKFRVSFRVSDVFNSRKYQGESYVGDTYIYSLYRHGTRTYFLKLSYKLNQYKPKRDRQRHDYGGGER